jgi:hypothetical protein
VESIKGTEQYERIMILLIGKKRWDMLINLEKSYLANMVQVDEIEMPSSEVTL